MIIKYTVYNDYCKLFDGTWSNKNDIQDFADEVGEGLTHSAHIEGTDVVAVCDVDGFIAHIEFSTMRNEKLEVIPIFKDKELAMKYLNISDNAGTKTNVFGNAIAKMSGA